MWVPEIKMKPETVYQREIDDYKKQGANYTIYYKVGLISLKALTDGDIDRLISLNTYKSEVFNSGKTKARYEILTHYKIIRRQEKILKLKKKISKKDNIFKRLFKLWI